jgi:hypothetical protein
MVRRARYRVRTIYIFHICTFLIAFAAMGFLERNQPWGGTWGLRYEHPFAALVLGSALLYQPQYLLDILPMYCVFILVTPALILALRQKHCSIVLSASLAVWILAQAGVTRCLVDWCRQLLPVDLGSFDILAWQLLFVSGIVLGYSKHDQEGQTTRLGTKTLFSISALAIVLFILRHNLKHCPEFFWTEKLVEKGSLGPLRILNFAILVILLGHPRLWPNKSLWVRALSYLGRNSLPVFSFNIIFIYLVECFVIPHISANPIDMAILTIATVSLLYLPAWVSEALKQQSHIRKDENCSHARLGNCISIKLTQMLNLRRKRGFLLVAAVGLLLAMPMIRCGYPDPTHDGRFHLSHQECFSRQLWAGEFYPRWSPLPDNGFGSPSLFYNPPLPSYVGAVFWRLAPLGNGRAGFALGWAASLGLILSGVATFWCLRRFDVKEWAAVIGAVIYMAAPYHLAIDLLDRGANSEFWAFVWMPLIVGALEDLSRIVKQTNQVQNRKHESIANLNWTQKGVPEILRLALWIACLFFTHIITSVTFAPVAAGFALFRGWRTFRGFLIAGLIALGLSAIYWLPLITYSSFICASQWDWANGDNIKGTFFFPSLEWCKPLMSGDVYNNRLLHIFVGFALVYVIATLAVWSLKSDWRAERNIVFWDMVLGWCLVMMLPISLPVYNHLSPLRHIQFAWRLMSCATLAHSLLVAFLLAAFWKEEAKDKLGGSRLWVGRMAAVTILAVAVYLASMYGVEKYREGFFDHGKLRLAPPIADVSAHDSYGELMPISANEGEALHLFPNASSTVPMPKLLGGEGRVMGSPKSARHWRLTVQATSPCLVVIPQYWFPGWKASGPSTGEDFPVQSEAKSGLVQIEVPQGRHSVDLQLDALWPELIGKWVSFGTACGLGLTAIFLIRRKQRLQNVITLV